MYRIESALSTRERGPAINDHLTIQPKTPLFVLKFRSACFRFESRSPWTCLAIFALLTQEYHPRGTVGLNEQADCHIGENGASRLWSFSQTSNPD